MRTGGPFRERLSGGDERSLDQRSQDPRAFAHGKSRRRLCKRIRRMKPAGKGTRGNNYCSKYRGHLGFGFYLAARMSDYDLANSEQPQSYAPHYVWQYFAVTNDADAKKGGAANAVCMFCYKSFVYAALSEQQHIFWGVLSWANLKRACRHTVPYTHLLWSTKQMMSH